MEIRFNMAGAERKPLVEAVSEIVGNKAVYMRAPTYAYEVQSYTIDKNGTLICDERTDSGAVHSLLSELVLRGFVYEDITDEATAGASAAGEEHNGICVISDAGVLLEDSGVSADSDDLPGEAAAQTNAPDRLVVKVPLDGFTHTALDNLEKLVASKADVAASDNRWLKAVRDFQNPTELTREMVEALVERIEVSGLDRIEVVWKFADEFELLKECASDRREAV